MTAKLFSAGDRTFYGPLPECRRCDGVGHLGPATGADQQDYGRPCPDCYGTGYLISPEVPQYETITDTEDGIPSIKCTIYVPTGDLIPLSSM